MAAATTTLVPLNPSSASNNSTVKELSDSGVVDSVPGQYSFQESQAIIGLHETVVEEEEIPTIDYSLLTGGTPDQRSQIIKELGEACQDWGFFMVVNHGVPESTTEAILERSRAFFDLTEDEKREYAGKHVLDPIRCGTSFNPTVEDVKYWRDYLKLIVHPVFHAPAKPQGFREALLEHSTRTRKMVGELIRGIIESLGIEGECCVGKALDLEHGLQILVANFYPPCPQPEIAMGMPPHSDHGLLTVLLQNGVDGLQVKHNGRWVRVRPLPNSFLVNTGDHLEIFSNGKYKSVVHRAMLNNRTPRISIAVVQGPSPETVVAPALQLANGGGDGHHPVVAFRGMKYRDYLEYQQSNQLKEKSALDLLRIPRE